MFLNVGVLSIVAKLLSRQLNDLNSQRTSFFTANPRELKTVGRNQDWATIGVLMYLNKKLCKRCQLLLGYSFTV